MDWTGSLRVLVDSALHVVPGTEHFASHRTMSIISLSLPNGLGEVVPVEVLGPLPITAQSNQHVLNFSEGFSRRAAIYATTSAEFTASGIAHIVIDQFIRTWGCPAKLLSDYGRQVLGKLPREVYRLMGIKKLATGLFHAICNGGTERDNHNMAQMLSCVVQ